MESVREMLTKFKTNRSKSGSALDEEVFADPFESYYYATEEDRRRPVFDPDSPGLLLYSHFMVDVDENGCRNSTEYLFHPLNYKTIECLEREACPRSVCPFFHNHIERDLARQLANSLQPQQTCLDELAAELSPMREVSEQLLKDLEAEAQPYREALQEKPDAGDTGPKGTAW